MTSDEKRAGMMYIGDDGRTVYALNNRGDRVNVRLDAPPSALWRRCPECKGRSFVVRHRPDQGSASIRACPVCRGSGEVACPAERKLAVADVTLPPVDLAAENAALREALAASGELLAEAHAEIERLRGAK